MATQYSRELSDGSRGLALFNISNNVKLLKILILSSALLYGAFSQPAPTSFGFTELLVGIGLVLAAVVAGIKIKISSCYTSSELLIFLNMALGALVLLIGICVGVWHGAVMSELIRDALPLSYLLFPMLLWLAYGERLMELRQTLLVSGFAISIFFTFRWVLEVHANLGSLGVTNVTEGHYLFVQEPINLFCLLYTTMLAFMLARSGNILAMLFTMMLMLFLSLPFIGHIVRAPLALWVFSVPLVLVMQATVSKKGAIFGLLLVCVLLPSLLALDFASTLVEAFSAKMSSSGASAKIQDNVFSLQFAGQSLKNFLLGSGFGIEATGVEQGRTVRHLHSLSGNYLIKAGFLGLIFALLLIAVYFIRPLMISRRKWAKAIRDGDQKTVFMLLAATLALVPPFFLQVSFKLFSMHLLMAIVLSLCYSLSPRKKANTELNQSLGTVR